MCEVRDVVFSAEGQPFLISGSGTLGWDQACCGLRSRISSNVPFSPRSRLI